MSNKVTVSRQELEEIVDLMTKMESEWITIEESEPNGIGTTLSASFVMTVHNSIGAFKTEIRGVDSW